MARECGVTPTDFGWICESEKKAGNGKFSIAESPCREIIREHYKLDTLVGMRSKSLNTWICEYLSSTDNHLICGGRGKTIAEAEKNCIIEICKHD